MSKCECDHAEKDHCKGGVAHSYYKDTMRMAKNPRSHTCVSRHCEQPLCDCLDYIPKRKKAA